MQKYSILIHVHINPRKCNYFVLNDMAIHPEEISNILLITNYKYLGLKIGPNLDSSKVLTELAQQYKMSIISLLNKRFLGINLQTKVINTVLLPKLLYTSQFILPTNAFLDGPDNFTVNRIFLNIACHRTCNTLIGELFKLKSIKISTQQWYCQAYHVFGVNNNWENTFKPVINNHNILHPIRDYASLPVYHDILASKELKLLWQKLLWPPHWKEA